MKSFCRFTFLVISVTTCCLPLSAGPSVIISEVMVNPDQITDTLGEWIELSNTLEQPIDLSGYTLGDNSGGSFNFQSGTTLQAGEVLVVARSLHALQLVGVPVYPYYFNFALNNGGDLVTLRDNDGISLDTVAWGGLVPGWELKAAEGNSLQRTSPIGGTAGWIVGQIPTPGQYTVRAVIPETRTILLLGLGFIGLWIKQSCSGKEGSGSCF